MVHNKEICNPRPELSCQIESEIILPWERCFCNKTEFDSDSDQVVRERFKHFGVIDGPIGTGKPSLVRSTQGSALL